MVAVVGGSWVWVVVGDGGSPKPDAWLFRHTALPHYPPQCDSPHNKTEKKQKHRYNPNGGQGAALLSSLTSHISFSLQLPFSLVGSHPVP